MNNTFKTRKEIANTFITILGFGLLVHLLKTYFHPEIVTTISVFSELKNYIFIASGLLATYLIMNYRKQISWKNIISIILLFICITSIFTSSFPFSIIVVFICVGFISLKDNKNENKEPIIPKRKDDLERIVTYLNKFESIGINAPWGDGKSFIIKELKNLEGIKKEYEFIEIDILSCNIDELQNIIISELENILYKNGIISNYSHRLKEILKINPLISSLKNFFSKNYSSYSEAIQGFKRELATLDKKIIIIYEDIDRINNIENIKKVFAISEKLTSERIKIIYQYEDRNLYNLGFDQVYLEKYIRYKINLTPLNFFEIIDFIFKHNKFTNIVIDDFKFLDENMQQNNFYRFNNSFKLEKSLYFSFNPISIRRIETFLNELDILIIPQNEELVNNKGLVIKTVFIKHFLTEKYEKIDVAKNLYDIFNFEINEINYTLQELYDKFTEGTLTSETLRNSLNLDFNRENFCLLSFFGFELINNVNPIDYKGRIKGIYEEPINNIKNKNINEKINRVVWKIITNGKSEYTDYEASARDLRDNVLSKSENEMSKAFEEFWKRGSNSKEYEENQTIALMGISLFIELSKALQLIEISEELKIKFFKFYLRYRKESYITKEFIQIINYFEYGSKDFYLKKFQIINELKINGNLNKESCFKKFLRNSINSINSYKIMRVHHFDIDNFLDEPEFAANVMLDGEIKKLIEIKNKIKNSINSPKIDNELEIITLFIKKMQELILTTETYKKLNNSGNISITAQKPNQEEYNRLKNLKIQEPVKFIEEINKSIEENKISIYEVSELIK